VGGHPEASSVANGSQGVAQEPQGAQAFAIGS
jgi:hypothetical protein